MAAQLSRFKIYPYQAKAHLAYPSVAWEKEKQRLDMSGSSHNLRRNDLLVAALGNLKTKSDQAHT